MTKTGLVISGIALLAIVGGAALVSKTRTPEQKFRKEKVDRGDVVATVSATGTLSAVTTVKVGSQVSGIISRLHVDYNAPVRKGQLLAELDPTPFLATVDQRRADVQKARVELRNAEVGFQRAKSLTEQQLQAKSEFDAALANRDGAKATVEQAEAALKMAETNLAYTKIASPIDGVVVDKQYDVGQTVAASFQAPVLFTIAQDITKMQVLTNLDEADMGRVRVGQTASFTVDAYPDRSFRGVLSQIRLSPQTVQNVVTYPVVLDVDNPDEKLKPGMTANVTIPVDTKKDVLRVANGALRFHPDPADLVPEARAALEAKGDARKNGEASPTEAPASGAPPAASPAAGRARSEGGRRGEVGGAARWSGGGRGGAGGGGRGGVVYVEAASGKLRPVKIKTGISDGNVTSLESDELKEGDQVVVGLATARASVGGSPGGPGRGPRF